MPVNSPPPLGITIEGKVIPGTEGMTPSAIAEAVLEGGKFVHFLYCVSLVVVTLRRSTDLVFVRRGQDEVGTAIGTTVLTSAMGWWGIPWGPIYSIQCLWVNLMGGRDLTREVVSAFLPPQAVAALMAQRAKPKVGGLFWAMRGVVLLVPILLFCAIYFSAPSSGSAGSRRHESAEFAAADNWVGGRNAGTAGGNTQEARELAGKFSKGLKVMREAIFKTSTKSKAQEFPAWCEIHEHECLFLVQVPELRRYDAKGQEVLATMAWTMATTLARDLAATHPDLTLAVGVRGAYLYDKVMVGPLRPLKENEEAADPKETLSNSDGRARLDALFGAGHPARGAKLQ